MWRMTTQSTAIASIVITVSRRDSPLLAEDPLPVMLMVSADIHLPAISKLLRVRVESSKKRLMMVRPRSVGQLLDVAALDLVHLGGGREEHPDVVAVEVGAGEQVPHRAPPGVEGLPARVSPAAMVTDSVGVVDPGEPDHDALGVRRRQVLADVVGADRQLAVAAVDEDREPHGARAAEVGEGVERGADGAPGVEDVVDEDDHLVVDPARSGCAWAAGPGSAGGAGRRGTS